MFCTHQDKFLLHALDSLEQFSLVLRLSDQDLYPIHSCRAHFLEAVIVTSAPKNGFATWPLEAREASRALPF